MDTQKFIDYLVSSEIDPLSGIEHREGKKEYVVFGGGPMSLPVIDALVKHKGVDPREIGIFLSLYDGADACDYVDKARADMDILNPSKLFRQQYNMYELIYGKDGIVEKYLEEHKDDEETDMHILTFKVLRTLQFRYELIKSILDYYFLADNYDRDYVTPHVVMKAIDQAFSDSYKKVYAYNEEIVKEKKYLYNIHYSEVIYPNVPLADDCRKFFNEWRLSPLYMFFRDIVLSFFNLEKSKILSKEFSYKAYSKELGTDNEYFRLYSHNEVISGVCYEDNNEYVLKGYEPTVRYHTIDFPTIIYGALMYNAGSRPVEETAMFMSDLMKIPDNIYPISEANRTLIGEAPLKADPMKVKRFSEREILNFARNGIIEGYDSLEYVSLFKRPVNYVYQEIIPDLPYLGSDKFNIPNAYQETEYITMVKHAKHIIFAPGYYWFDIRMFKTIFVLDPDTRLNGDVTVICNRKPTHDIAGYNVNDYIVGLYWSIRGIVGYEENGVEKITLVTDSLSPWHANIDWEKNKEIKEGCKVYCRQLIKKSDVVNNFDMYDAKKLEGVLP